MRLVKKLCLIFCAWIFGVAAYASTHNFCNGMLGEFAPNEEADLTATAATQQWLNKATTKLSSDSRFLALQNLMMNHLTICQKVECTFRVNENGEIIDLKVTTPSGSTRVDDSTLSFIKSVAPLPKPPNNIPNERGVLIEFCKIDHWKANQPVVDIMLWGHMDRETWGKKYSVVKYLDAETQTSLNK